ncbi:hypothetical protein JOE60_001352 [Paenarthrobacter ilicis]|uniref:Uncharacterized protein n=1 Tax=Paenarthrobacter ilicis TaxID=43665 RepID=A0ABX0TG90_9MICC|nr:hypothetical protein [Paenarthrobacter ilicis]NIJ01104.1 hypothetical protein [Paenarthrobacter ilicis]
MTLTLMGALRAKTIREFGNDQCFPAAANPVPLEGTGN